MKEIVLNQFERRRSIRKIQQRGDTLYVECLCCHILKPKSEFNKQSGLMLGVVSQCKKCLNKKQRHRKHSRKLRLAV